MDQGLSAAIWPSTSGTTLVDPALGLWLSPRLYPRLLQRRFSHRRLLCWRRHFVWRRGIRRLSARRIVRNRIALRRFFGRRFFCWFVLHLDRCRHRLTITLIDNRLLRWRYRGSSAGGFRPGGSRRVGTSGFGHWRESGSARVGGWNDGVGLAGF